MWPARRPMAMDVSCGFHVVLSSGTRSSVFRVVSISCSNSGRNESRIAIFASIGIVGVVRAILPHLCEWTVIGCRGDRLDAAASRSARQEGGCVASWCGAATLDRDGDWLEAAATRLLPCVQDAVNHGDIRANRQEPEHHVNTIGKRAQNHQY